VSGLAGWTAVGVLAAIGALARCALDDVVQRRLSWRFPVGILAVNASGSLALGVLAGAGTAGWPLRLAGAALLGSYTTFSTWIFDSQQLVAVRNARAASLNIAASALLGIGAVALGFAAGSVL
jgi:fluoride exporter